MMRFRHHNSGYQHHTDSSSVGSSTVNSKKSHKSEAAVLSAVPESELPPLSKHHTQQQPPLQQPQAQPQAQQQYTQHHPQAASNTDTIMDLAATVSASKIVYKMEEEKKSNTPEEDAEVERIVSAVTKGLRKNKNHPSSSKSRGTKQRSRKTTSSKKVIASSERGVEVVPLRTVSDEESESYDGGRNRNHKQHKNRKTRHKSNSNSNSSKSSSSDSNNNNNNAGIGTFLHRMMHDESVGSESYTRDDSVDYDYNYIDDDSYGNTSHSSSDSDDSSDPDSSDSSQGTYSSDSDGTPNGNPNANAGTSNRGATTGKGDDETADNSSSDGSSTASLTAEIESSFDTLLSGDTDRPDDEPEYANAVHSNNGPDPFFDPAEFAKKHPQGLDIVAHLLEGAKEVYLDVESVVNDTTSKKKAAASPKEVAKHVADALAQTTHLQSVSFCGPWKGRSHKARVVLEILFAGLLENTSVHTVVIRDNHSFDRYAGYAFGTLLKAHSHGHLQKLELANCRFVGSGWFSLLMGLQHSTSIKRLSVEDCTNLRSEHLDGITSTIQYLNLETLRLSNVQLHAMEVENLSYLFRAIQQTKTLRELDLSKNKLGAAPRSILLLSRCLAGDPVSIETSTSSSSSSSTSSPDDSQNLPLNYHHHIEKLTLVDCALTEKSFVRALCKALDSTLAKLDAHHNEHPLKIHTLDVSKNPFGNSGAKILQKLLENNASITTFRMVGCGVGASHLKKISDRLRYNNSFLQKIGLSSDVSLAILDSVSAVEHVFSGRAKTLHGTNTGTMADDDEDSVDAPNSAVGACGGC